CTAACTDGCSLVPPAVVCVVVMGDEGETDVEVAAVGRLARQAALLQLPAERGGRERLLAFLVAPALVGLAELLRLELHVFAAADQAALLEEAADLVLFLRVHLGGGHDRG